MDFIKEAMYSGAPLAVASYGVPSTPQDMELSPLYQRTPTYADIKLMAPNKEIRTVKQRKASSLGMVTLGPQAKGKRYKVTEYVDGSFLVEEVGNG